MPCKTADKLWAQALAAQERCDTARPDEGTWLDALTELQQAAIKLVQHERTCPICNQPTAAALIGR